MEVLRGAAAWVVTSDPTLARLSVGMAGQMAEATPVPFIPPSINRYTLA